MSSAEPSRRRQRQRRRQECRLIHADVLAGLSGLADDSVDLVVTSPPYADARADQYGGPPPSDYVEWYAPIARELKRVVKKTGWYVLNIKERIDDGSRSLYVYDLVKAHVEQAGWDWYDEVIWCKPNAFPTGRLHLRDSWEHCYLFCPGGSDDHYWDLKANRTRLNPRTAQIRERGRRHGIRDAPYPSGLATRRLLEADTQDVAPANVISYGTGGNTGAVRAHPAAFPLGLPGWFIRMLAPRRGTVLDPFCGSGTSLIAAEREGRTWLGIDSDPHYIALASSRLERDRRRRLALSPDVDPAQAVLLPSQPPAPVPEVPAS